MPSVLSALQLLLPRPDCCSREHGDTSVINATARSCVCLQLLLGQLQPASTSLAGACTQQHTTSQLDAALHFDSCASNEGAELYCVVLQASADDKFANYKPTTAFFFPGQGAQSVGMAKVSQQSPAANKLLPAQQELAPAQRVQAGGKNYVLECGKLHRAQLLN